MHHVGAQLVPTPPENYQAVLALLSNHLSLVGAPWGEQEAQYTLVPDVPSLQDVLVTIYFPLGHVTLTILVAQQVRFEKRKLYELYQDLRVKATSS